MNVVKRSKYASQTHAEFEIPQNKMKIYFTERTVYDKYKLLARHKNVIAQTVTFNNDECTLNVLLQGYAFNRIAGDGTRFGNAVQFGECRIFAF